MMTIVSYVCNFIGLAIIWAGFITELEQVHPEEADQDSNYIASLIMTLLVYALVKV